MSSVYVFGGGQVNKARFDDVLKLQLPATNCLNSSGQDVEANCTTKVESVSLALENSTPSARTYHASCLVKKFMVVSGGEANNTDLSDLWAFNILDKTWYELEILEIHCFQAKRFHSISAVSQN